MHSSISNMDGGNLNPYKQDDYANSSREGDAGNDAVLLPRQAQIEYGSTETSRRTNHKRFPSFRWGSIDLTQRRKSNICI